ncbi:hypothetical protein AB0G67_40425 [Streptomyces sp. NPDC021056]|uniref:hypothetical protein n=1 Tax=Streptomyces sp. NPDC021056 TaxID=3155012 RepID=UPI0033E393B4
MTAKGLLATLIRAKDGDDVTVEALCKTHTEGREVLTKAMRALVEDAFVVKFKIQRGTTETVTLADGSTEQKRGGSWWTTFTVDSIPFTVEDVTAMLEDIYAANGNVKAVRVEPTRLDRRERASDPPRPTSGNPSVGATCGNALDEGCETEDEQVGPTDGFPTAGGPTVGRSAAHIRKKTSLPHAGDETDDAPSARSAVDVRRTSTTGSSADHVEGGCAASSNTNPSPTTDTPSPAGSQAAPRHSKQQLDQVRAVRAHFPADLLNGWTNPSSGQVIPPLPDVPALSQAILDALEGDVPAADRTVEQLGARIVQRWNHHGWGEKYYRGEINRLVGAAIAMVRPLKASDRYGCANPRCEAGKDADTGVDCHVCPKRLEDRRAARKEPQGSHVPAPRPASPPPARTPFRECACRNPIPKGSDDTMCRDCRRKADSEHLVGVQGPAPF